jgi:ribosome-associated heat shock protein Hsp15
LHKVRLDKWLWAARFYKTRSLATDAVNGGKVSVNGHRVKAGKDVTPGMILKIGQGVFSKEIIIKALSDKRGPANAAQSLYEETEQSKLEREQTRERIKLQKIAMPRRTGKPDKHDRKKIIRFQRKL